MTKEEFIVKAKEFGYMDEDIEELVALVEEANSDGVPITFDYAAEGLIEQPVY
nr:MAG TPA: hypothetical protein [Bacteriophage sp.]